MDCVHSGRREALLLRCRRSAARQYTNEFPNAHALGYVDYAAPRRLAGFPMPSAARVATTARDKLEIVMHLRIAALIALLFASSLSAAAGEASGEFTVGKRAPIRPTVASAFETRDQRDPHKRVVEVVLSEAPVDVAAAMEELDPHSQIINQPALMHHNYVLLWVRPDGDVSMNATYSETMTQFVDMTGIGGLSAEVTTNTPARVSGRGVTPKPMKTSAESYTLHLR